MNNKDLIFIGWVKKLTRKNSGLFLAVNKGTFWKPSRGRSIEVEGRKFKIGSSSALSKNGYFITLHGITDTEMLYGLVRKQVFAPKEDFYVESYTRESLAGASVILHNGKILGKVTEVLKTGANDVLQVQGEKEWLIPFVKSIVAEINLEEKNIKLKTVEGLLD